jgi:G patch domain-containing protein 1
LQRGKALGEEQLKEPTKSIFDYMSAKSKERLAQIIPGDRQAGVSTEPEQEVKPEPTAARDGVIVPPLSPRTASAALKGFIPFGDDPAKQERYTSYLRSQTHDSSDPNPKLLPVKQLDQINKELSDFAKSAQMFRPLSFAMANRFTSSKLSARDMVQPKPGLHIPDPNKVDEWKDKTKLEEEIKEVLTPREEAARAGMFGKMTRVTSDWVPHALLCKRFGVANPWPDGPPGSKPKESGAAEASVPSAGRALGTKPLLSAPGQDVAWQNNFVHQTPGESSRTEESTAPGEPPKERQPRNIGEVGLAEDVNQGRDTLTYKKPEMDIFKAIFASDDEGDDSDDEDQDDNDAAVRMVTESKPAIPAAAAPSSIADREYSPAPPPPSNLPIASDIARPVFAPSAHRLASKPESDAPKSSAKKKDKKRDRAKAKTMLSFDMGDDEGDADDQGGREEESARERDRKRRRKEEKREEKPREKNEAEVKPAVIDEDDEWVEAPPAAR